MAENTIHVAASDMAGTFEQRLLKYGMTEEKAQLCAKVFTENSLDGVYTHGVYRFVRFVQYIREGVIVTHANPAPIHAIGALEQWNGHRGPGITNAMSCTDRVMQLADAHGIGCLALANTNHWMRGGTYGWRAATSGYAFIAWTNTTANMPAWGAVDCRLGNNPLVLALPYGREALVLDMAMSQYSYGALELHDLQKRPLPVPGGYDEQGNLTTDPAAIRASRRVLPVGFWKGAGLSLMLDMFAAILSGGLSTAEISKLATESSLSQVFIAIKLTALNNFPAIASTLDSIVDNYKASLSENKSVRYPGEGVLKARAHNQEHGIPVLAHVWQEILDL